MRSGGPLVVSLRRKSEASILRDQRDGGAKEGGVVDGLRDEQSSGRGLNNMRFGAGRCVSRSVRDPIALEVTADSSC